jgi:hypothetical protein
MLIHECVVNDSFLERMRISAERKKALTASAAASVGNESLDERIHTFTPQINPYSKQKHGRSVSDMSFGDHARATAKLERKKAQLAALAAREAPFEPQLSKRASSSSGALKLNSQSHTLLQRIAVSETIS